MPLQSAPQYLRKNIITHVQNGLSSGWRWWLAGLLATWYSIAWAGDHQPPNSTAKLPNAQLDDVLPAVVNLSVEYSSMAIPDSDSSTEEAPPSQEARRHLGMGSGVIVNAQQGYIVTNAHVVHQANRIIVTLSDGRRYIGRLLGIDTASDLAVVAITPDHLTSVHLGSSNHLKVGSTVIAIGNPFGLNQTVTAGIVSGKHRSLGMTAIENFIQTDAPINPGNSGGALFDQQGHLVGINSAILATTGGNIGIGFAIPIELVEPIVEQIITTGMVSHGRMGIMLQDLTPTLAESFGHSELANHAVLVSDIFKHAPADQAGLKSGDIIVKVNDLTIEQPNQISSPVAAYKAGTTFKFKVVRQNKTLVFPVKTTTATEMTQAMSINHRLSGIEVAHYDATNNQGEHVEGVRVTHIQQGGHAWLSGLAVNDVILAINQTSINGPKPFIDAIHQYHDLLLFKVLRGGHLLYLSTRLDPEDKKS